MKKTIIFLLFVLSCYSLVFGGEFEITLKKAEQGNAMARYSLGVMYHSGEGVPQDHKKAFFWYKKAATQGDSRAQYFLGGAYKYGIMGVPQDYKQALFWHEKSAMKKEENGFVYLGNPKACHEIGNMYKYGKGVSQNYKEAFKWFKRAAEEIWGMDDSFAQFSLGLMYDNGFGVKKNHKQALYWYKKSASNMSKTLISLKAGHCLLEFEDSHLWLMNASKYGDAYTQESLGQMYYSGQVVLQDYKQAVYWFTKAAEQGDADAQFKLSILHYEGKGTPQNFILTYVWESLAASQGYENAANNRDITAKKLTPHQLVEAQKLAAEIQHRIEHRNQKQSPSISKTEKKISSSGTGFFITKDGYILTCHHVIKDAEQIKIVYEGSTYTVKIVRDDTNNDLSLLKINGSFPALAFSSYRSAQMGQEVFTIGFPNPGLQGVNAKYTKGTISSLTGFQDDLRLYQISVPVQPGNSGGALLDKNGNILGVIIAMLNAKTAFKISGSLPQNVNYAIKSIYSQAMLDTLPEISDELISPSRSSSTVVDRVKRSTVMVLCYQ